MQLVSEQSKGIMTIEQKTKLRGIVADLRISANELADIANEQTRCTWSEMKQKAAFIAHRAQLLELLARDIYERHNRN